MIRLFIAAAVLTIVAGHASAQDANDCISTGWGESSYNTESWNQEIIFRNKCAYDVKIRIKTNTRYHKCRLLTLRAGEEWVSYFNKIPSDARLEYEWCVQWLYERQRKLGYKSCYEANLPRNCW